MLENDLNYVIEHLDPQQLPKEIISAVAVDKSDDRLRFNKKLLYAFYPAHFANDNEQFWELQSYQMKKKLSAL